LARPRNGPSSEAKFHVPRAHTSGKGFYPSLTMRSNGDFVRTAAIRSKPTACRGALGEYEANMLE
jgi:hypothetical protein